MPPRRTRAPVRSTQSTRRVKADESSPVPSTGSPDPIALTPAPTQSRALRSRASKGETSSPAPSSTQAPSSELRARNSNGSGTKTRLRSGRRSKGFVVDADILGDGELVVPSDEEEYEAWIVEKRQAKGQGKGIGANGNSNGESSKMAQERWAKQRDRQRLLQVCIMSPSQV
jgi:hypothetical protein